MDINSLHISGRLTKDMDLRYTKSGEAIGNFSIACNGYTKKDGSKETLFLDCVLWGKVAEAFQGGLKKGKLFFFNGRLASKPAWTSEDGVKHDAKIYLNVQGLVPAESKNESKSEIRRASIQDVADAMGGTFALEADSNFPEDIPF